MGSAFVDVILHPLGDPTAVTIIGGAGEDKIFAGLNDTIVTNDDTDADIIYVDTPASFAQIYDEVPVIQAGPEDVIEIELSDEEKTNLKVSTDAVEELLEACKALDSSLA